MNYSVSFDEEAEDEFRRLSPQPKDEVNKVLKRLRGGPDLRYDLQLEEADELWRARAGRRWRVIFSVGPGRHIQIRRIRRRRGAYRGIEHPHRRDVRESEAAYEAPDLGTIEGSAMSSDAASATTLIKFRLPEPPERNPDEVTSHRYVHLSGNPHFLAQHFAKPETTIVSAELFVVAQRGARLRRVPDLLIAFDVDPELYYEQNGYVISDQGKPPDFILEVASPSTAKIDTVDQREDYAALGISEYWRFDHTGESHGTRLAGDRLVEGRYEPIEIVELEADVLQGESAALKLRLRWDHGELGWIDPATGRHIPTFDDEREGRLAEREGRIAAEAAQRAAEARVRELEAELRRREG